VTYHRDALSILEAVPRLWARLRGKCFNCGNNARSWRREHGECAHCLSDLAWCHWCNKGRVWLAAYGAPPEDERRR
jgi:hypothetical protein